MYIYIYFIFSFYLQLMWCLIDFINLINVDVDDMIACASDITSEVYTKTVCSNGHVLSRLLHVTLLLSHPERCKHDQSICLGSEIYHFLSDTEGFWQFSMAQKTLERVVVLESDPPPIMQIHSISARWKHSLYKPRQQAASNTTKWGCSESNRWDRRGEQQKWPWKSFCVRPANGRRHRRT